MQFAVKFFFRGAVAGAMLACAVGHAATYPSRPIRMILPFSAGASSDIVGRTLGAQLGEQMGESFVPDNHPGAGGSVGVGFAAKAPPDGYSVLLSSPAIALAPLLYKKVPFDPAKDFVPIARVGTIENVMVVHPTVPAKTLREFIALARKYPGKLSFGSGGVGTTNHLANAALMYYEKINMLHVPYKGAVLATLALMTGEVDEVVVGVAPVLPLIKEHKVRPLVVLSKKRVPVLPDVPTSAEAGVPKFRMSIWYGMFAPAKTPSGIVARLTNETIAALESPGLVERMRSEGVEPWPGTPREMADLMRVETARYAEIIRGAHIKRR